MATLQLQVGRCAPGWTPKLCRPCLGPACVTAVGSPRRTLWGAQGWTPHPAVPDRAPAPGPPTLGAAPWVVPAQDPLPTRQQPPARQPPPGAPSSLCGEPPPAETAAAGSAPPTRTCLVLAGVCQLWVPAAAPGLDEEPTAPTPQQWDRLTDWAHSPCGPGSCPLLAPRPLVFWLPAALGLDVPPQHPATDSDCTSPPKWDCPCAHNPQSLASGTPFTSPCATGVRLNLDLT